MAKKPLSGFAAEFTKQRAALGAGKTFTYQGKSYSTNRADDKPSKPAAKPTGMASSPRPMPKPAAKSTGMASSPRPMPKPAEAAGAAGGARVPGPTGKYSPTDEMRMRAKAPAAAPKPAAPKPAAPATSQRPQLRSAEFIAANGGARKPNSNGKYSPTEEARLRKLKASSDSVTGVKKQ